MVNFIRNHYSPQHFNKIKKLLIDSSPFILNSFEITMIKSIVHTFDETIKPNEKELLAITDYLFSVEHWGYYEITLFGNCVRTLNYSTYFLLSKEMIGNYLYTSQNKTNKKIVTQLAINCLIASIDTKEYSNCEYLIKEIDILLQNELNYYEKTVFLYAQGYFEYKTNKPSGISKMEQSLLVFRLLNENENLSRYSEHFNNILSE